MSITLLTSGALKEASAPREGPSEAASAAHEASGAAPMPGYRRCSTPSCPSSSQRNGSFMSHTPSLSAQAVQNRQFCAQRCTLCAKSTGFCTEQAAPKAKNSAFATAFREMNHDFYRFPILSHRIELVVRTKPSFSCSVDASMHKTDGFVREALGLCRAPRPERCAAAGNERAAHRAAPRKRPRGRRASRLNAQPAPLPTASPRRPSRHRAPRVASSQPERRSRHRSRRRAPRAARPPRRPRHPRHPSRHTA